MKLVVLDRDGVINEDSDDYIKSPQEFVPISGSLEAIRRLNDAGFTVAVATNQSGVGRGLFNRVTLNAIHEKLKLELTQREAHIDKIVFCPHTPQDECACRKPKPGLLRRILNDYGIHKLQRKKVCVIGDSIRDLQMAQALDVVPLLVRTGKGVKSEQQLADHVLLRNTPVFDDLSSAADYWITHFDVLSNEDKSES